MPTVKTMQLPNFSLKFNKARYSVLAGSITINGTADSFKSFWQVVVLPLPVTPAIKVCLLKKFFCNRSGIFSSSRPFCIKFPKIMSPVLFTFKPNSTPSTTEIPGISFCGSPANSATSSTVKNVLSQSFLSSCGRDASVRCSSRVVPRLVKLF